MAKGRKLKVFQAQVGFYDTVVAAPSQAAALRAWGIHQNLFKDSQAHIASDAQAVDAALAHPEIPLRRALGSTDPFALEPASLPTIPDVAKGRSAAVPLGKAEPRPEPPKKQPADRSALDAAEAALRNVDGERKLEEAALRQRQAELDKAREASQIAYVRARKAATGAVVEARQAYRKGGGED